jgi:hypothetical protein
MVLLRESKGIAFNFQRCCGLERRLADWGHKPSPTSQIASEPRAALGSLDARFAGPGLNAATAFTVQELPGPRNRIHAAQKSQPHHLLDFLSAQAEPEHRIIDPGRQLIDSQR